MFTGESGEGSDRDVDLDLFKLNPEERIMRVERNEMSILSGSKAWTGKGLEETTERPFFFCHL